MKVIQEAGETILKSARKEALRVCSVSIHEAVKNIMMHAVDAYEADNFNSSRRDRLTKSQKFSENIDSFHIKTSTPTALIIEKVKAQTEQPARNISRFYDVSRTVRSTFKEPTPSSSLLRRYGASSLPYKCD